MTICDNCIHDEVCGLEGHLDEALTFCANKVADEQPIRHGRWTDNVYKYDTFLDAYFIQAKCSVCGRYSDRIDIYSRFMSNECCSRCGARMDLKDGDNNA